MTKVFLTVDTREHLLHLKYILAVKPGVATKNSSSLETILLRTSVILQHSFACKTMRYE